MIDPEAIIKLICQYRHHWQFDVGMLANHLQVSPSYLREIAIIQFGTSPHRLIEKARLSLALDLLREENCIYKVSLRSGYNCVRSFRRSFRTQIGMTPSEFLRLPAAEQNDVIQSKLTIRIASIDTQQERRRLPQNWPWLLAHKIVIPK